MSGPGRGSRSRPSTADYRSYDEYEDAYGAPRRPKPYYYQVDRAQRPNTYDGQVPNFPRYRPYPEGVNDHYGPPGLNQAAGPKPRYRAPYSTQPRRRSPEQLASPLSNLQQPQPPYPRSNSRRSGGNGRPPNSNSSTSSGWAPSAGSNGQYNRPSVGGSGAGSGFRRQPSRGRQRLTRQTSADGSAGGSRGHSAVRLRLPNGFERLLPSNASNGGSASGSVGGGGHSSNNARLQDARGGAADGRLKGRAPFFTAQMAHSRTEELSSQSPSLMAAGEPQNELPNNPDFLTPSFPQPPRTRTDSCSSWALMSEAGCQSLEAVVGPFLEGLLMEVFGAAWERELYRLELRLPPFSAAACAELIAKCKPLHDKLPITIHKRLEVVAKAAADLEADPGALGPGDVTAADTAMKGVVQDCIKAMNLPSLLGTGSRQFVDFTTELLPHMASTLLYYDTLIADCADAASAWKRESDEEPSLKSAATTETRSSEVELPSAGASATTVVDDTAGAATSEAAGGAPSGTAEAESGAAA